MNNIKSEIRQKYSESGYESLNDKEKLMLALSYSETANKIEKSASNVVDIYGNIHAASNADTIFLMKECEIDFKSALFLSLISQIRRRCEINNVKNNRFNTSENAKNFFCAYLKGRKTELAAAAAVNRKFNIINTAVLAYGGFSEVHIPIRVLVDFALKNEADYIFIAHCHPENSADPSASDILTTKKIKSAFDTVGVTFADHIITGNNGAVSLRELEGNAIFDELPEYELQ